MNYKVVLFLPACSAAGPLEFRAPTLASYDASGMHQPIRHLEEATTTTF